MVANWCQVCKSNGKSVDHLLHCPSARELWQLLQLIWCHLGNAQFSICYVGFLEGKLSNLRSGDVWGASPSCLMWCIWNERNLRTFEGKELPLPHLESLSEDAFQVKFPILYFLHSYSRGLFRWSTHQSLIFLCFFLFSFFYSFVYILCTRIAPYLALF